LIQTLQGRPKHTKRCPNKVFTDQAVPIDPQFGIDIIVLGTRLSGLLPLSTSSLTCTPLPVMSRAGEYSRLVMENPLLPHLGTRLTGPIPEKCLVHSKAYPMKPLDQSPNSMLLPHEQFIYKDLMIPT
jgi:hypothetical protein